jgi:hypothetical protein
MSILIGGNTSTQAAGLKYGVHESGLPVGLWRLIFLALSAAILFCVLGAVWALTQTDKKLAFGEADILRITASSVAGHE